MSGPRRFDRLRASGAQPASIASQEETIESVIRRHMLASVDGQRILAWLQDEVSAATPLGCSEAALRDAEGARRLVQKLIAKGVPSS
jgi:hypothetical protein